MVSDPPHTFTRRPEVGRGRDDHWNLVPPTAPHLLVALSQCPELEERRVTTVVYTHHYRVGPLCPLRVPLGVVWTTVPTPATLPRRPREWNVFLRNIPLSPTSPSGSPTAHEQDPFRRVCTFHTNTCVTRTHTRSDLYVHTSGRHTDTHSELCTYTPHTSTHVPICTRISHPSTSHVHTHVPNCTFHTNTHTPTCAYTNTRTGLGRDAHR